jgi:hypothetical protein
MKQACFKKIHLYHNYKTDAQTFTADVCDLPEYVILQVYINAGWYSAPTRDTITTAALLLCGDYNTTEYDAAIDKLLKLGVLFKNKCGSTDNPWRFILNSDMDKNVKNKDYILYIIINIGGYTNLQFFNWFIPKCGNNIV